MLQISGNSSCIDPTPGLERLGLLTRNEWTTWIYYPSKGKLYNFAIDIPKKDKILTSQPHLRQVFMIRNINWDRDMLTIRRPRIKWPVQVDSPCAPSKKCWWLLISHVCCLIATSIPERARHRGLRPRLISSTLDDGIKCGSHATRTASAFHQKRKIAPLGFGQYGFGLWVFGLAHLSTGGRTA